MIGNQPLVARSGIGGIGGRQEPTQETRRSAGPPADEMGRFVSAVLALAGCSVDNGGQHGDDSGKPTIRIGYQTFPSGDLIVKNNK